MPKALPSTEILPDQTSETPKAFTEVDKRKRLHEAIWKQSVSRTHRLWCDCGQFLNHFKICAVPTTTEGPGGSGDAGFVVDFDLGFVEDADEALDAALRYAEEDGDISAANKM
nr:ORF2 [Torque teno felis virus]